MDAPRKHIVRDKTVEEIVALGIGVIGETLEFLNERPLNVRDFSYAKAVAGLTRAAVEISRDQREAADFIARQKLRDEDLMKLLTEYLAKLPQPDFALLVEQAREKRAPQ